MLKYREGKPQPKSSLVSKGYRKVVFQWKSSLTTFYNSVVIFSDGRSYLSLTLTYFNNKATVVMWLKHKHLSTVKPIMILNGWGRINFSESKIKILKYSFMLLY